MFELLGADDDDVRLWINRAAGYSIPLPGTPMPIAPPIGGPRYDAVVRISDLPIEVGVRIDEIPTQIEPAALVASLVHAYVRNRTDAEVSTHLTSSNNLPRGAAAGISCMYALSEASSSVDVRTLEYLYVAARFIRDRVHVLYFTARYPANLNPFRWRQFRGALYGQHRWDGSGANAPLPSLYPDSALAHPGIGLAFTDHGMAEASAKADMLAPQSEETTVLFVRTLFDIVTDEAPPTLEVPSFMMERIPDQLRNALPPSVVEVLTRNLDEVTTFHDLRAWAWQCVWAIGNARGGA